MSDLSLLSMQSKNTHSSINYQSKSIAESSYLKNESSLSSRRYMCKIINANTTAADMVVYQPAVTAPNASLLTNT
ncbi:hypothetical protein MHIR_DE00176 [Candidatus Doolittlea endobia]|uniref:Uncharacterized protein n=1 Tax=Candidatus Doolittlea endobia TaxID=1778262 RepID=A0A143WSJ9_9ENTR|nr:hypothetical protein MHIR_DE00176 [Candidatus Doolittlea endobia]